MSASATTKRMPSTVQLVEDSGKTPWSIRPGDRRHLELARSDPELAVKPNDRSSTPNGRSILLGMPRTRRVVAKENMGAASFPRTRTKRRQRSTMLPNPSRDTKPNKLHHRGAQQWRLLEARPRPWHLRVEHQPWQQTRTC